jgi:hypothetical protein
MRIGASHRCRSRKPLEHSELSPGIYRSHCSRPGDSCVVRHPGDIGYRVDTSGPHPSPVRWVIVGGESGPDFRPMEAEWARAIRDQCLKAGVAFFFKQWGGLRPTSGGHLLDDRAWTEYPAREQDQPGHDTWRIETTVGQERLPRGHAARATTVPPTIDEDNNSSSPYAAFCTHCRSGHLNFDE